MPRRYDWWNVKSRRRYGGSYIGWDIYQAPEPADDWVAIKGGKVLHASRGESITDVIIREEDRPRRNPGFTKKEERKYKAIVRSGRRRYGRRAKEVAARTVLKGRSVRRGKRSNPPKKYETTLNGVHVKFFQGYAEDVRYIREADGKPYSHVVETNAAELYLAEHSVYGRCILIVDPSGKTPLWG